MSGERYALISVVVKDGKVVESSAFAPRCLLVLFGTLAIAVGVGAVSWGQAEVEAGQRFFLHFLGIMFILVGAGHYFIKASFSLDMAQRRWREDFGWGPFGRAKSGSFDDALGLQWVIWAPEDSELYAVVWCWKDPSRRGKILTWARKEEAAREKWIALAGKCRLPRLQVRDGILDIVSPPEMERT